VAVAHTPLSQSNPYLQQSTGYLIGGTWNAGAPWDNWPYSPRVTHTVLRIPYSVLVSVLGALFHRSFRANWPPPKILIFMTSQVWWYVGLEQVLPLLEA
jgi:hypothetical protein